MTALEQIAVNSARRRFRDLIRSDALIRAPGVVEPIAAKLVEAANFDAVYITGGGISRSMGFPDVGLVTASEMLERVRLIIEAVNIPAIVDVDTGYGNAINLVRTVRGFEDAGVAAIHIEDQVTPKKCGHYTGKVLVSTEEMVLKLRAAIEARRDPDLVIIARTDARAVEGLDAAIERSKAYIAAGADMLFFEAPESFEDMCAVAAAVKAPLLLNMFGGGKTPAVAMKDLQRIGYRVVIFPSHLQRASIRAMQKALDILKRDDLSDGEDKDLMVSFTERDRIVGLQRMQELEGRYLTLSGGDLDK
jgi:2-methylisocitrate lyase-like PEP mutase family enzyme